MFWFHIAIHLLFKWLYQCLKLSFVYSMANTLDLSALEMLYLNFIIFLKVSNSLKKILEASAKICQKEVHFFGDLKTPKYHSEID